MNNIRLKNSMNLFVRKLHKTTCIFKISHPKNLRKCKFLICIIPNPYMKQVHFTRRRKMIKCNSRLEGWEMTSSLVGYVPCSIYLVRYRLILRRLSNKPSVISGMKCDRKAVHWFISAPVKYVPDRVTCDAPSPVLIKIYPRRDVSYCPWPYFLYNRYLLYISRVYRRTLDQDTKRASHTVHRHEKCRSVREFYPVTKLFRVKFTQCHPTKTSNNLSAFSIDVTFCVSIF